MSDYLSFWGKAQPRSDTYVLWHPVAYHCFDVAACGRNLLEQNKLWRGRLSELLQLSDTELLAFVTFLLALHDIGKFSKPFQGIVYQYWPADILGPWQGGDKLRRHDTAGWWLWRQKLKNAFSDQFIGIDDYKFDPLMRAVMGHHGTPPEEDTSKYTDSQIGPACIRAAQTFADDAAGLFLSGPIDLSGVNDNHIKNASWLLAGLTTLADWIGSNQRWFAYCAPDLPLDEYWQTVALKKAPDAVAQAGLSPCKSAGTVTYRNLADIGTPSPMQNWAQTVPLTEGPGLYLIEDMTGSGKTEAALMIAHRLMAAGKADGLFFALPTQATANAMYERLEKAYGNLFAAGAKPSLVLAHGSRDLMEKFAASRFTGAILDDIARAGEAYDDDADEADLPASAQCAAWIADDRRLAFLADVGAGTIDQALLAILPSRHQSLRLAGLMRRVLVLDEIHAYDAYMQVQIETLLEFHCALGGSAILLSATLHHEMKLRLCEAYGGKIDVSHSKSHTPTDAPYPLATIASVAGTETLHTKPRKGSVREVPVKFLSSPEEGMERVRAAANEGQAVLYIRNTVNDAIETFDALSHDIENISLFHARFAYCDRLRQERQTLKTFGKASKEQDRLGQVLVATQVVEQSLDLDFDLIVTDLAPIDLLIQRAGRLWRHERENRLGECELLVVSPYPVARPDEDWIKRLLPGTGAVYKDHARLWLTARLLKAEGKIKSPDSLRALIEGVYSDEVEDIIPDGLKKSFNDFLGREGGDRGTANYYCLNLSKGYAHDAGLWSSDEHTPTRLGEPTTTFRLARLEEGRMRPWALNEENINMDEKLLWRLSEAGLSCRLADGAPIPTELAAQEKEIRESWGKWQDDKNLLILQQSDTPGLWQGSIASGEKVKDATYSPRTGLTIV